MIFRASTCIALAWLALGASVLATASDSNLSRIDPSHPLIYYHGRWDKSPGTWWASSGFKLHIKNLRTLSLTLGDNSTKPQLAAGVSINYGEFMNYNLTVGENLIIPSGSTTSQIKGGISVVRINVQGWQNNRLHLKGLTLNRDAILLPYKPSKLAFQFIGDSLTSGQFLPKGINQAWPFLVGEHFKAEHSTTSQPGAALTDIPSYGNIHGVSYQFFQTEDTGFNWASDHNYTTPWNFKNELPKRTHIVIHIGANDSSQNVTADQFLETFIKFIKRLRSVYPHQPIFLFTPWGWPSSDGSVYYYYEGVYEAILRRRHEDGDTRVHLVNTTGWVTFDDVFPDNVHPHIEGHEKIASKFIQWLGDWGLPSA